MSHKKERFSTIEELNLSAMSRGISTSELVREVGFPWKGHRVVLTGDGIFHFFRNGMEVAPPDFLVDISEISKEICDKSTENVVIPSGVTSIGDWAFYSCTGLTSVTIPDSVTSIGDWVFYGCSGLTGVTIPDSVTSIGFSAFSGCIRLKSITIPRRFETDLEEIGIDQRKTKVSFSI